MTEFNIGIIGAGRLGTTLFHLLSQKPYFRPTLAGTPVAGSAVPVEPLNARDFPAVAAFLEGKDAVVAAVPAGLCGVIAAVASQTGTAYFDACPDAGPALGIRNFAERQSGTLFAPGCGFAPGVVATLARGLMEPYDRVTAVDIRVGVLPQAGPGGLRFELAEPADALVARFHRTGEMIRGGQRIAAVPLDGLESVWLDGVQYEAFNASGGLGTLAETLEDRVETLRFQALRYPGSRDALAVAFRDLGLGFDGDTLAALRTARALPTTQDEVVLAITVEGILDGLSRTQSYRTRIHGQALAGVPCSASPWAGGNALAAFLDLWANGHLPPSGLFRPEDLNLATLATSSYSRIFLST